MSAKTLNSSRKKKEQRIYDDINDFRSHDGHVLWSWFQCKEMEAKQTANESWEGGHEWHASSPITHPYHWTSLSCRSLQAVQERANSSQFSSCVRFITSNIRAWCRSISKQHNKLIWFVFVFVDFNIFQAKSIKNIHFYNNILLGMILHHLWLRVVHNHIFTHQVQASLTITLSQQDITSQGLH